MKYDYNRNKFTQHSTQNQNMKVSSNTSTYQLLIFHENDNGIFSQNSTQELSSLESSYQHEDSISLIFKLQEEKLQLLSQKENKKTRPQSGVRNQRAARKKSRVQQYNHKQNKTGNDKIGRQWIDEQIKRQKFDSFSWNFSDQKMYSVYQDNKQKILIQNDKQFSKIQPFEDYNFPPTQQTLGSQEFIRQYCRNVNWKKISEISPNVQVFAKKPSANELRKGALGNCYFLSGLAALVQRPEIIFSLFFIKQKNKKGLFSVRLLFRGKWKVVNIDEYFPFQGNIPAFSSTGDNSLWVMILEKAWAKLYGNYEKINSGYLDQIFHSLTAAPIQHITIDKNIQDYEKKRIWKNLQKAEKKNFPMLATTFPKQYAPQSHHDIFDYHAYTILGTLEHKQIKIVQLRDPWGKTQIKNKLIEQQAQKLVPEEEKKHLFINRENSDGIFFMSFQQFLLTFQYVAIAQVLNNATYLYCSQIDVECEGVYFFIEVQTDGKYTFSVDPTPERVYQNVKSYRNPHIYFNLQNIDENMHFLPQNCHEKTFSHTINYLEKGKYCAFVKIDYNRQLQKDFQVTLAVYSQKNDFLVRKATPLQREQFIKNNYSINDSLQTSFSFNKKEVLKDIFKPFLEDISYTQKQMKHQSRENSAHSSMIKKESEKSSFQEEVKKKKPKQKGKKMKTKTVCSTNIMIEKITPDNYRTKKTKHIQYKKKVSKFQSKSGVSVHQRECQFEQKIDEIFLDEEILQRDEKNIRKTKLTRKLPQQEEEVKQDIQEWKGEKIDKFLESNGSGSYLAEVLQVCSENEKSVQIRKV